jgi:flagellar motor protein MotB
MESAGLPAGRIDRIIGHADRMLVVPQDPLHASNRRITLLVRRETGRPGTDAAPPSAVER